MRSYLLDYLDGSFASDEYEADDLIYFNTQLMNQYDYIICSIDKDLKQIPGIHYDYYQMKVKDENGEYMVDEFGQFVKVRKGFKYVTESEAEMMQFTMMLTGDVSDNVKGVHGIGQKKAEKLAEKTFNIPVLYLTELLALSYGISPEDIGIKFHRTRLNELLEKYNLV